MAEHSFYKRKTIPSASEEIPLPETPTTIGPYKIESLLSKGGMSLLYLGTDPEKKSPIVLKILSPQFLTNEQMTKQFLKEAQIIGMTDHPNIIKLYGQGEWENGLYIAMEFVQGISLRQFIIQQSLSLKSALQIILQVSYALLHLHTHGVIHRDLKPENILITENGQVKVIDFGIAQLVYDQEMAKGMSQFLGTPSYMSPEQKKDPLSVTYITDIYSLGVVAYELIIGRLTFGSINISLLPKKLRAIIGKALAPSIEDRYQDIVDFISELSSYLKSNLIEEDYREGHETKQLTEKVERAHQSLLPAEKPKWTDLDLGIAKPKSVLSSNYYYDYHRFANGSYLILLGEMDNVDIESIASFGMVKGIIQTLLRDYLSNSDLQFNLKEFIALLNQLLFQIPKHVPLALTALHLIPRQNQFVFSSCGFEGIWHLPADTINPRMLTQENPVLGMSLTADFSISTDRWDDGDVLYLHTFNPAFYEKKEIDNIEKTMLSLFDHIQENTSQAQAEMLLSELNVVTKQKKVPKVFLALQRII